MIGAIVILTVLLIGSWFVGWFIGRGQGYWEGYEKGHDAGTREEMLWQQHDKEGKVKKETYQLP